MQWSLEKQIFQWQNSQKWVHLAKVYLLTIVQGAIISENKACLGPEKTL